VTTGFHQDDTPSLQLYQDGTFYCYGCDAGGSIYDFAARLWGVDTKGRAFLDLRARLADELGLHIPTTDPGPREVRARQ
jgi:DNA primase